VKKIDQYEIVSRLACGGMAEVFLGRWQKFSAEKWVVIKRILPHLAQHPEFVQMFLEEVRVTAKMDHPNIVHIYDAGMDEEGAPYMVMEYVPGVTLKEVLDQKEGLTLGEGIGIGIELAKALSYAHSQNPMIIHRDISPQNILLSVEGFVKLTDFGIAKAYDRVSQTQAGVLKGKLPYMAPEFFSGSPPSPYSDQYAFGLVLYEIFVGERAYPKKTETELLPLVQKGKWERNHPRFSGLPPPIRKIIEKTLSSKPQERYPDFRTLLRELQGIYARMIPAPYEEVLRERVQRIVQKSSPKGKPETIFTEEVPPTRIVTPQIPKPSPAGRERKGKKIVWILTGSFLLLLSGGGLFFMKKRFSLETSLPPSERSLREEGKGSTENSSGTQEKFRSPTFPVERKETSSLKARETLTPREEKSSLERIEKKGKEQGKALPSSPPGRKEDSPPQAKKEQEKGENSPTFSKGFLTIVVVPWAFVSLKGEVLKTPILRKEVPPGEYTVRLRNPSLQWDQTITVTVEGGKETRFSFDIEKGGPP
jgi:serine/threonine protein kinase